MVVRRLVSTLVIASFVPVALGSQGCATPGGENAASQFVKTPELPADSEARCKLRKSQSEPLIVEWANSARGALESRLKRSLVPIRYSGCELEQLPACTVKTTVGTYAYSPITRKQSKVTMHNADELFANMPVGAISLEGKLKTAGQLEVNMTIVGRYEAPTHTFYRNDLEGDCEGATHVIAALTTGSFTFSAGGDAELGGGINAGPAGAGGKSTAKRETLQSDGDEAACARATSTDKGPPEGCGALLQIEVTSIGVGNRPAPAPVVVAPPVPVPTPVEPPAEKPTPPKKPPKCKKGEHVEDGICVKNGKKPAQKPAIAATTTTCSPGQHKEGTKCVDDPPAEPVNPPPPPPITQCAEGMRLEGDHCVSAFEPPPRAVERPAPVEEKPTPSNYDAALHPTEESNPVRTTLAYVAMAMGLTAGTAGLIALKAAGEANDDNKHCDAGAANEPTVCADGHDKRGLAIGAAVVADVALGLGAISLITMFLLPKTVKVGATPTRNGAVAGASWSF